MNSINTLKALLQPFGPTGRESRIADLIRQMIEPYVDELRTDTLGNVIAYKRGGAQKRVMLAAHMDQIGLILTHVEKDGFLRVTNVGGVRPVWELFQKVLFANGTRGVVAPETRDIQYEKLGFDTLFVDIGATTREEALQRVSIGDICIFTAETAQLGNRLAAPYMDDRAGCAILVETLKRVQHSPYDIYAVFTVQEEIGLKGAAVSAYSVAPDLGIALDVTPACDTPNSVRTCNTALGKGPAIKMRDSSLFCHPLIIDWMKSAAAQANIPYQLEVLTAGGTDAGAIQYSRAGVPSGVLSLPTRYIHTVSETIDQGDYQGAIDLLSATLMQPLP